MNLSPKKYYILEVGDLSKVPKDEFLATFQDLIDPSLPVAHSKYTVFFFLLLIINGYKVPDSEVKVDVPLLRNTVLQVKAFDR